MTLRNVSRTFIGAQGERIEAIRDVNLDIEDAFSAEGRDVGEFHVLLGPFGCGKSTVLRLIAGLDRPDTGEVLVNGERVCGPGRDRGMVFQKYTSFPWRTVEENIGYGLKINDVPAEERRQTVARLVEAVGLRGFEKAFPGTLSGGMQQRVAIAWTLALRPQVISMDEPCGALDAQTRAAMQQLADRISVISARPGTIMEEIPVPLSHPRDASVKLRREFVELQQYVLACLRGAPGHGQVRVSV